MKLFFKHPKGKFYLIIIKLAEILLQEITSIKIVKQFEVFFAVEYQFELFSKH